MRGETLKLQGLDRDAVLRQNELSVDPSDALNKAIDEIAKARSEVTPSQRRAWDQWLMQELLLRHG